MISVFGQDKISLVDIKEMIKFYSTPTGKKIKEKVLKMIVTKTKKATPKDGF